MTISSKEVLKRYFETGDRPTQAQFADMFDSLVIVPGASASAVSPGLVEVESTAKSTARALGAFGASFISLSTTAAAHSHLGATAVGKQIYEAATTAAARTIIGVVSGGTVGQALYEAATTAAAQQTLGGGTVGRQIFEVSTTAAAQNIVGSSIFTLSFTSSDQTITTAGALTLAHGLGVSPKIVVYDLVCQTNEAGYTAGQVLPSGDFSHNMGGTIDRGMTIITDATNITVRYGALGNVFAALHATTGVATVLTNANWKVRFRAYA